MNLISYEYKFTQQIKPLFQLIENKTEYFIMNGSNPLLNFENNKNYKFIYFFSAEVKIFGQTNIVIKNHEMILIPPGFIQKEQRSSNCLYFVLLQLDMKDNSLLLKKVKQNKNSIISYIEWNQNNQKKIEILEIY